MKLKRTVLGPVLVALVAFVSGGWLLQQGGGAGGNGFDPRHLRRGAARASRATTWTSTPPTSSTRWRSRGCSTSWAIRTPPS